MLRGALLGLVALSACDMGRDCVPVACQDSLTINVVDGGEPLTEFRGTLTVLAANGSEVDFTCPEGSAKVACFQGVICPRPADVTCLPGAIVVHEAPATISVMVESLDGDRRQTQTVAQSEFALGDECGRICQSATIDLTLPTPQCAALGHAYDDAVIAAQQCDPSVATPCAATWVRWTVTRRGCGWAGIDPSAQTTMDAAYAEYLAAGCEVKSVLCQLVVPPRYGCLTEVNETPTCWPVGI